MALQRSVVLVGGTGTGKAHRATAIARACIRDGARGRFFTVVDLVTRLEAEARSACQGLQRQTTGTSRAPLRQPLDGHSAGRRVLWRRNFGA